MKLNKNLKSFLLLFIFLAYHNIGFSQKIDTTRNRVDTGIKIPFTYLGTLKPKNTNEIKSSNWLLGCETLDRDYANYDAYKDYLVPLGIKKIRLQGGWDKTEKVKGVYDWAWLDYIINDAVSKGLSPWLQLSYGNHLYQGGGGANLGAGMPHSEEALKAWDKWVAAAVNRYKTKVFDWEIWNEPNFGDNTDNTPEKTAALNIRTIDIIKKTQSNAKVSGLAIGHINLAYADEFFKILYKKKKLDLFDNMTYHDYVYNPDSNYGKVELLRLTLQKYSTKVKLRQGENGAPSEPRLGGALADHDWSELSQAKWNTRRMLGDLGHDIESSVFTIIEIAYTAGPIQKLNVKGLIKSDSTKKALRPKVAYYAVQNITSIFDDSFQRIKSTHPTFNTNDIPTNGNVLYSTGSDRSFAVYGYENKDSKKQLFTIWVDDYLPTNSIETKDINFTILNGNMDNPVYVDIITGKVYEIPKSNWTKTGIKYIFKNIPVYDAPILIADKSLVKYQ
ncbi:hypothetical protein A5893_09550 [Pedobacter psychrophilus]|uniref:Glycoside hydrolase family 42 N-terminal domain-containing protein n=1 Tax=Pedobacter psychrophilus TaxID=1826909 RepID=A0A179DFL6_9SPHI|nr:hypothetical protein [Pedobacter psychrophilus]OAQ39811.1 hypothetical protein A5893_09550 [Pedobacter psychrophilus]